MHASSFQSDWLRWRRAGSLLPYPHLQQQNCRSGPSPQNCRSSAAAAVNSAPSPSCSLRSRRTGAIARFRSCFARIGGAICQGRTPLIRTELCKLWLKNFPEFQAHTMQGISICGSVASPHGASCRRACVAKNDVRLPCEINAVSRGLYSLHWCVHRPQMKNNGRRMNAAAKTNARWLFGGDGRSNDARLERSESANEDILIFYFQMDLQTRIQYALNIEQFDVAKQLREKLTEIETEIIRQREARRGSPKTEAQDKALNLIRVRADLQKAIDSENYALAAGLRDEIAKLEAESLAVSAKALAYQNVKYAFRLGQKVRHNIHGYRGVICGMDPVCCESKSWMETANVEKLSKGPNQPFYQVLVDVYVDPELLVAYVAEENLSSAEESEKGRFDHPYIEFLFYGEDTAGDFIPIKQLREKYDQARYEASGDESDNDGNTNS